MTHRERPILIYDGDCAFCTDSARWAERRLRVNAEVVPFQFTDLEALGIARERAEYEVLWVEPDGRVFGGAQGIAKLLQGAGGVWRPLGVLLRVPPVRWIAHGLYRLVAANRHRMPGGTAACALPPDRRANGGEQG